MGKSAKWFKSVILGKKPSKSSSGSKERVVSGNEVLVTTKVEESDVVTNLPSFANTSTNTIDRSIDVLETHDNIEPEEISDDDETKLPKDNKPTDETPLSDAERFQQEIAATYVQAAFRGYLARRAFWALKGIIRLQALIRGHLVRRQAVATLCCVMGIVKLQAVARGKKARNSNVGVQVHTSCNNLGDSTNGYLGIKKLTANAFAKKLLASSPKVIPVHANYDATNPNSNTVWLENWSASCFWKPIPQPKKTTVRKPQNSQIEPKKSVRKVPTANLESSVHSSIDFEKQKRSFRKVSSQSIEPVAVENPQIELEKVKRSLRKVHNPLVQSSIIQQPQPVAPHVEVEKPTFEEPKQELLEETNDEALDSLSMVNQIDISDEAVVEEKKEEDKTPPKVNKKESSGGKENQKAKKKSSSVTNKTEREESNGHHQTSSSPSIPSYMQATKSAKAKLRQQGSPKSTEQDVVTIEKARRQSLPSPGSGGRVTSHSPRTTRLTNSGDKAGNKKEKPLMAAKEAKITSVERKR